MANRPELKIKSRKNIEPGSFGIIETTTVVEVPAGCVGIVAIRRRYGDQGIFLTNPFLWGPWKGTPELAASNKGANLVEFIDGEAIAHVALFKELEVEGSTDGLHDHNYPRDTNESAETPE